MLKAKYKKYIPNVLAVFTSAASKHGNSVESPTARIVQIPGKLKSHSQPKIKTFELSKEVVTVGRSSKSTIILKSKSVSRHHAVFRLQNNGTWTVEDSGRSKGVYINKRKLEICELYVLNHEDVLNFGPPHKSDPDYHFFYIKPASESQQPCPISAATDTIPPTSENEAETEHLQAAWGGSSHRSSSTEQFTDIPDEISNSVTNTVPSISPLTHDDDALNNALLPVSDDLSNYYPSEMCGRQEIIENQSVPSCSTEDEFKNPTEFKNDLQDRENLMLLPQIMSGQELGATCGELCDYNEDIESFHSAESGELCYGSEYMGEAPALKVEDTQSIHHSVNLPENVSSTEPMENEEVGSKMNHMEYNSSNEHIETSIDQSSALESVQTLVPVLEMNRMELNPSNEHAEASIEQIYAQEPVETGEPDSEINYMRERNPYNGHMDACLEQISPPEVVEAYNTGSEVNSRERNPSNEHVEEQISAPQLVAKDQECSEMADVEQDETEEPTSDSSSAVDVKKSFKTALDSEMTCAVCGELFIEATVLQCSHTFCRYCISQWRVNRNTCPICRDPVVMATQSLAIDNLIDKMVERLGKDAKHHRRRMVDERRNMTENNISFDMPSSSARIESSSSPLMLVVRIRT